MVTTKVSPVLHFAHSKLRSSKPGLSGSMQANLIGLPHPEQFRTPISATLKSGLGRVASMILPLDQAGARHSQSPIVAHGGTMIEPTYALGSMHAGQYCSLSKNQDCSGHDN
jgi:hypothetical protein